MSSNGTGSGFDLDRARRDMALMVCGRKHRLLAGVPGHLWVSDAADEDAPPYTIPDDADEVSNLPQPAPGGVGRVAVWINGSAMDAYRNGKAINVLTAPEGHPQFESIVGGAGSARYELDLRTGGEGGDNEPEPMEHCECGRPIYEGDDYAVDPEYSVHLCFQCKASMLEDMHKRTREALGLSADSREPTDDAAQRVVGELEESKGMVEAHREMGDETDQQFGGINKALKLLGEQYDESAEDEHDGYGVALRRGITRLQNECDRLATENASLRLNNSTPSPGVLRVNGEPVQVPITDDDQRRIARYRKLYFLASPDASSQMREAHNVYHLTPATPEGDHVPDAGEKVEPDAERGGDRSTACGECERCKGDPAQTIADLLKLNRKYEANRDRLQGEVERLRAGNETWEQMHADERHRAEQAEQRAGRLSKTLRKIELMADVSKGIAEPETRLSAIQNAAYEALAAARSKAREQEGGSDE